VVIGLITFVYIDPIAGVAFLVLGLVLYWLLYRFARKLGKEIGEAKKS
jgi:membrane protein implicated in regulation of membrane protease activity